MTDPDQHLPEPDGVPDTVPGPLMDLVRTTVAAYGWTYRMPSSSVLSFILREEHTVYEVTLLTDEERSTVGCFCVNPVRVPAARRSAVAEALVRINYGLALGGFDLDFSDGELRYRFAIDVEGGVLSERMVQNLIACTVHTSERYHDALLRIAFGDGDPEVELLGLDIG